ncbi:MAG: CDC27 family protein [Phycisphaerales bacterium]|nr:CDC27 family protein [Phycisphaerales bacterium]
MNQGEDFLDDIENLLQSYKLLQSGYKTEQQVLSENEFIKIIDYFDVNEKLDDAVQACHIALAFYPYNTDIWIALADLLISLKQYDVASDTLDNVYLLDNQCILIYILRVEMGLICNASPTYCKQQIMSIANLSVSKKEKIHGLLEMVKIYNDYGREHEAFLVYKNILLLDENNLVALNNIVFCAGANQSVEEAIEILQQVVDKNPFQEHAWVSLGMCFHELEMYEKSLEAYNYALSLNDELDNVIKSKAVVLIKLHHYDQAVATLQLLGKAKPLSYSTLYTIGQCYLTTKKVQEAKKVFIQAHRLEPNKSICTLKIATCYILLKKWNQALDYLEKTLTLDEQNSNAYLHACYCCIQLGQFATAQSYILKSVMLKPTVLKSWILLINCSISLKDTKGALKYCKMAITKTKSKYPILELYYSLCLLMNNKHVEALRCFKKIAVTHPKIALKFMGEHPALNHVSAIVKMVKNIKPSSNKKCNKARSTKSK